jgi:hypothetical protein
MTAEGVYVLSHVRWNCGLHFYRYAAYLLGGPEFWNKAQGSFFALFETYNGMVVAVVGLIASVYFFRKHDWKLFWLSLAFIAGGSIFAYDGVWSLIRRR